MIDPETFFVQQSMEFARTKLPLSEAVLYLRGLLKLAPDNPALEPVRLAFTTLSASDRQLELIQIGQLKLDLKTESHEENRNQES